MQRESRGRGQRELAAVTCTSQGLRKLFGGNLDDLPAACADRVVVGVGGEAVGRRAFADRQCVQHPNVHQGRQGAVHRREVDGIAPLAEDGDDLLGTEVAGVRHGEQHGSHRQTWCRATQPVALQYRPSVLNAMIHPAAHLRSDWHHGLLCYCLRMNADKQPNGSALPEDQTALIVEVFRMLADSTRVQILWALADGERSVNELAEHVAKPAPSVSQHLAKLRMARLVRTRREGTQVIYRLENDHVRQLVIDAVFNAEHAGPGVPGHHRNDAEVHPLEPTSAGRNTKGNSA